MADMSPEEQLMLELINRARLDPNGEARRFGIKLNEGVAKGDRISADPKQVLAGNDDLADAAESHSKWMIGRDIFSHEEKNGSKGFTGEDPRDRMEHAGYIFEGSWASGENIAWRGSTGAIDLSDEIARQHRDLFVDKGYQGRGHRLNILSDAFEEIGIGQVGGKFKAGGTNYNASMVTQDFATAGNKVFITGVVYDDNNDNDFFSVGEQVAGRNVSAGAVSDQTGAGGGYELQFTSGGARSIDFALAGGTVTVGLTHGASNVKLDIVNGDEVWTNADITSVSANVSEIHALGIAAVDLAGGNGAQAIYGNKAANVLEGRAGADWLWGGKGKDELHGGSGADTFVFTRGSTANTIAKADLIADFSLTDGDLIDLSSWDANAKKAGNQDFQFIGVDGFHKRAGELRYFTDGGETIVQGDTNGDGKADLVIRITGLLTLPAGDFIL